MKLTPNISVLQSHLWHTNTGIIHTSQGSVLIDPGIFPDEFAAIAAEAGSVAAGFCTHAHWDHLLWHESFGAQTPRFATSATVALIRKDRDRILKNLSNMEAQVGEQPLWNRSLLFAEQPMEWGSGNIAGLEVELLHIPGHCDGQAALVLPEHDVAFVADTLSDVETPAIYGGSRDIALYLRTLNRLQKVIDRVDWIVPGHGSPANRDDAQRRLDADRRYLQALVPMVNEAEAGEGAEQIARRMLVELEDTRAESELAWSMHLHNIQLLVTEREQRDSNPPVRKSSRIILLNQDNRVWMLRIADEARPRWILPGGGVEEGESWEQAALREMWEECAINDAELGPLVATRDRLAEVAPSPSADGTSTAGSRWIHQQERYFLVRAHIQQPHIANMLDYEIADYASQRWFSADEIRSWNEVVYPLGLEDLLDQVSRGEIPIEPIRWPD